MASKIGIAFVKGGIIPAAIMKKDKDVHVPPHDAIEVPADYAQHLIDDKFAYAKDVEKPAKDDRKGKGAAAMVAAEKAVADAEAKVTAAADDIAAKADAEQELSDAQAALATLKG
ncbi:hypothetical protein J2857_003613 [Neorhizobium galegae]|uniref:hypothetical protein n=1 Tax=Neorhizobium galegae TaxID=399 RepID=UPI001AE6DAD2|nr:hypothetical protein [Neorhizobium galegae]MBP2560844.1 hypothetical protein [Neorhizobium galegae]